MRIEAPLSSRFVLSPVRYYRPLLHWLYARLLRRKPDLKPAPHLKILIMSFVHQHAPCCFENLTWSGMLISESELWKSQIVLRGTFERNGFCIANGCATYNNLAHPSISTSPRKNLPLTSRTPTANWMSNPVSTWGIKGRLPTLVFVWGREPGQADQTGSDGEACMRILG